MSLIGKLAVFAFLFLLTGLAVTWASPASGSSQPTQLTQDQQKLCLNCHSPRDPPNDTTHVHKGGVGMMDEGAPCWLCHGDQTPSDDVPQPTHVASNQYHPNEAEATAAGKDLLDCGECHYKHDILAELASGTLSPPPANSTGPAIGMAPAITVWAPFLAAGVSLITGIAMIAVVFSSRKRSVVAKGGA